jgi:L-ascorbate metabolism protein UlaG (beta-lactamase superfamily)
VKQGIDLFNEVRTCQDEAAFWWLGQATYIVKLGKAVALVDPFLSRVEGRRVPPLFSAEDARGIVTAVLCTHDHLDHLDPEAVPGLAKSTDAFFVAPRAHAGRMASLGVPPERLFAMNDGETISAGEVTVSAVKASHEFFDQTLEGLYPCLGYVMQGAGRTLYHSGDTVWWEGLQARLSQWQFDAMMLPINGRDARRLSTGIIGNMVYQEAADLAGGLAVKLVVPMHYDMFASNAEDPSLFVDYVRVKYPQQRVWVGGHTTRVAI